MKADGKEMMKLLLSFGIFLSLSLTGCAFLAKSGRAESLYRYNQELPLSVGSSWVYRVTRYDGYNPDNMMTATFTMTDTITSVENREGFLVATVQSEHTAETLIEVEGDYPVAASLQPAITENYWLIVDGNRLLRQDGNLNLSDLTSRVQVQLVFPIRLTSQWPMTNGTDAALNEKVTEVGSITVPAGKFDNCFYLEGILGGMAFENWFCPGIGMVWSSAEHQGTPFGHTQELVSYTLK